MGGNSIKPGVLTADPAIIAREAKRVAALAAKELKQAGEAARSVPVGTPTWTGTVGIAGRPGGDNASPYARGGGLSGGRGGRGGGPSSSAVLANLSARQGISTSTSQRLSSPASGSSRGATPQAQAQGKDFMKLIRDYLIAHGGAVYTQMLIDHFNRYCGSPERTAEFKEMLKVIAVLDKGDGGGGGGETASRGGRGAMRARGGRPAQHGAARGGRGKWVLKKEYGGTA